MISIIAYKSRLYYQNKWGDKEYINGNKNDDTLIQAAILTGKGLKTEEEIIYVAYGETEDEAEKSLQNYIAANPNQIIDRKELINI